ncbi:MAG: HEPN domain-containing protein [Aequorivita sp.]|nr:HEPN domain-containing protein [Aequorivita sp.]
MPYFIEDLIELDITVKLNLGRNLIIRVASIEEIDVIKSLIPKFGYSDKSGPFAYRYHESKIIHRTPQGGTKLKQRLKDDFRYFVLDEINYTGIYNQSYAKAFLLSDTEFFIPFGFSAMTLPEKGISIKYSFDSELSTYSYFNDLSISFPLEERKIETPKSFTNDDKSQIINILLLIENFEKIKNNYPIINKAYNDFFKISELSDFSVFKVVSYFACLELLLVDNKLDKLKSISSQLESKLDLLNNRMNSPIKVSDFIKGPDTLTLGKSISILYGYRSSIAHGDFVDFEKKLQILNKISKSDILNFLRTVLKRILLISLEEPQLISDLKNC